MFTMYSLYAAGMGFQKLDQEWFDQRPTHCGNFVVRVFLRSDWPGKPQSRGSNRPPLKIRWIFGHSGHIGPLWGERRLLPPCPMTSCPESLRSVAFLVAFDLIQFRLAQPVERITLHEEPLFKRNSCRFTIDMYCLRGKFFKSWYSA